MTTKRTQSAFGAVANSYAQKQVDTASLPWDTGSPQLWSLWTMLETYAWHLVNHIDALTALRERLQVRVESVQRGESDNTYLVDITETDRANFALLVDGLMRPWLKSHSLTASYDQATRILDELVESEPDIRTLISQSENLSTTLEDELRRRVFLYVPPEDVPMFKNPETFFPRTHVAYKSAQQDINEACSCYALGRYTASVFHSMAILQVGLYALADSLKVAFSYSLNLAEWGTVITAIEAKIKVMREGPRSDEKDATLSFYSECASQFRYFKDAWRNHVAHNRDVYDSGQAHSVLFHVRDFMEKLSQRVPEKLAPPEQAS